MERVQTGALCSAPPGKKDSEELERRLWALHPQQPFRYVSSLMKRRILFFVAFSVLILLFPDVSSHTSRIVLPRETDASFGSSGVDPFFGGCCTEQVYAASEFDGIGGLIMIEEIAFRLDETGRDNFDAELGHITLQLNTTRLTMEEIVENGGVGAFGSTLVFSNANHRLTGTTGITNYPIRFKFQNPFLYDPIQGHLVLTINRTYGYFGTGLSAVDAHGVGFARGAWTYRSPSNPPTPRIIVTQFTFRMVEIRIISISRETDTISVDIKVDGNLNAVRLERSAGPAGPYLPDETVAIVTLDANLKRIQFSMSEKMEYFRLQGE